MAFEKQDCPSYFRTARYAARVERNGDYRRAAQAWHKAYWQSQNRLNQIYSENRSDFCIKQSERNNEKPQVTTSG